MRVLRMALVLVALLVALRVTPPVGRAVAAGLFPQRAITLVVPFIGGGPVDVVAHAVADMLAARLGQPVLVTRVAGSGGTRGAAEVARAAPDGYTLLFHHVGMATAPTLYPRLSFDVRADFAAIGLVGTSPMVLLARKGLPAPDAPGLLDLMRQRAASLTYGHAGPGSASHLCGLLLMSRLSTALTTVTYQGTGPALKDLAGGQIDVMCDLITNAAGAVRDGSVRGYAVTSAAPAAILPDLPALAQSGLAGFEITNWYGLYAPARTPAEITGRLAAALAAGLDDEALVARLAALGVAPVTRDQRGPQAHRQFLAAQIDAWEPVLRAAGAYGD